jgi:hypothetical protein
MAQGWENGKRIPQLGVPITVGVRMGESESRDVAAALSALARAGFHAGPTSTTGQLAQTALTLRTMAIGRHGDSELEELSDALERVEVHDGE